MPFWLTLLAVISLCVSGLCALIILLDILGGRRQPMAVMNVVWPVTGLYGGPLALWLYLFVGRPDALAVRHRRKPRWQSVAVSTLHCGSGCTLGDIIAEWLMFLFPFTLFGRALYAGWVIDFIFAFLFGIAFQYASIKPMKRLSPRQGLIAALKADTLSLTAWQAGMYGGMAIAVFLLFGHELHKTDPVFWLVMQWAMWLGFAASYPVNVWLLRRGIKEPM